MLVYTRDQVAIAFVMGGAGSISLLFMLLRVDWGRRRAWLVRRLLEYLERVREESQPRFIFWISHESASVLIIAIGLLMMLSDAPLEGLGLALLGCLFF